MLPSDWAIEQDEAKVQVEPAKLQARKMLGMLCKIMLPVIQSASGQTMNLKEVLFGIEVDEFITELEAFIIGIISRSQARSQDITIETTLGQELGSHSEEDEVTTNTSSNDKGDHPVPRPMTLKPIEDLEKELQTLREHVTQNMPIRLLCFEAHGDKLKISLFERADIYNYLALQLRADLDKEPAAPVNGWIWKHCEYAILSHTWNQVPGELTYGDWKNGSLDATHPKYQKLVNFCKVAWQDHGLTLGWIDTVCINKESSAELDESIRSMYAWYRDAAVCITYLAATNILSDMHNDPWFTRGWTLQELLAPRLIEFYSVDWNQLSADSDNDKDNSTIRAEIELATTITWDELLHIHGASISRRMQLAAKRQVTRAEDIAYCLMGIFDVSISTAYGEGADRAFFRLVEEIFRSTKDISDIFNWAGERENFSREPISSLFPSHPSNYLNRLTNEQLRRWRPIEPLTLTHLGLRTPVLLMPAIPLLCESILPYPPPVGDYHTTVSVAPCTSHFGNPLLENLPKNYLLLDKRISGPEAVYELPDWVSSTKITLAFGTLNMEEQGPSIRIPKTCLAVLLARQVKTSSPAYEKAYTENPIVFDLKKIRNNSDDHENDEYYLIERSRLEKHGMQLVTLYL